jgi:hypothetical protein
MDALKICEQDPKIIAATITKKIGAIKRSKQFFGYWEADALGKEIYQMLDSITTRILPVDSKLAARCCEKILELEKTIFDHADDSSGGLGGAIREAVQVFGKTYAQQTDINKSELAEMIFNTIWEARGRFGIYDHMIPAFTQALGKEGLHELEQRINTIKPMVEHERWSKIGFLKDIADGEQDVDKYIHLCEKEDSVTMNYVIFDIAKRLNAHGRGVETIKWLEKFQKLEHQYNTYISLLIEAYLLVGENAKAQSLQWQAFKKTLTIKYYQDYLRYASAAEIKKAEQEVLNIAEESKDDVAGMHLLAELQEYGRLAKFIIARKDRLRYIDYAWIRALSKTLDANNQSLAAVILRRDLVDGVLARAQSKYYKYAISDIKLARDYAAKVTDWQDIKSHNEYVAELKQQHGRKSAFWDAYENKFG